MGRLLDWVEREVVAIACAVSLLLLVFTPRNAGALSAVVCAIVTPAIVLLARREPEVAPTREVRLAEWAVVVSAGIVLARALFAQCVPVALWGARGQHTGAWLWVALAASFIAVVERARKGDLMRAARAVAITGGVLALSGLLTAPFLVARFPWLLSFGLSDSPAGLAENSISLAQMLLVAIGASGLWALEARTSMSRRVAAGALALCGLGLLVTNTRAAWVALVVVGVVVALIRARLARARNVDGAKLAVWAIVAAVSVLAVTIAAGLLDLSSVSVQAFDKALNGRVTIWHAAVTKLPERLAFGSGPDQFTAWATWDSVPGSSLEQVSTDDPHSWVLGSVLSTGLPGFIVAMVALWALARIAATAMIRARWRWSLGVLVVGLASWGLVTMTSWTSPLAALLATLTFASMTGDVMAPRKDGSSAEVDGEFKADATADAMSAGLAYVPALVALSVAAAVLYSGVGSIRSELAWALALRARSELSADQFMQLAKASGDPAYAVDAAKAEHLYIVSTRQAAEAGRALTTVAPALHAAAGWSVYAALEEITLRADAALLGAGGSWRDVAAAVDSGRKTDPSSGIWDYVGAVHMAALGRGEEASDYASESLRFPLPDAVRIWSEGMVIQ